MNKRPILNDHEWSMIIDGLNSNISIFTRAIKERVYSDPEAIAILAQRIQENQALIRKLGG